MNALDLSAHERPIALVEIRQLQHLTVAKFERRISEKQICQVASPLEIEIHRQKGEIVSDIDEAEAIVEFDAIENRQCIWRDVDVVEVEIAVAIVNAMLLNSFAK